MDPVLVEILQNIRSASGRPPITVVTAQTRLREDLNMDSFDLAEMAVRIESQYGVDVFEAGIPLNVGDLLARLPQN